MLIKSLRYKNFRQFKGEYTIKFSDVKEKNVTIILGNNTFGKTTLLQMFNWCLYEESKFNNNPKFLLNLELAEEMPNNSNHSVEIEVIINHDNKDYTIHRKQDYMKVNEYVGPKDSILKVSYIDPDSGKNILIKSYLDMKSLINTILPKDLSDYFLFDTERVQGISDRKDLASAVKGLLGLSVLENTINHIGKRTSKTTVLGSFYQELNTEKEEEAQGILEDIDKKANELNDLIEEKSNKELQIEEYDQKKKYLEKKLRDLGGDSKNLQSEKDYISKEVLKENELLSTAYEEYIGNFQKDSISFFAQPLFRKANDFLVESKIDDKGIRDVTSQSIKEIIARGRCLCGCEIVEGSTYYNNLIEELKFVPPESIGTTIRNFKIEIERFNSPNLDENYYKSLVSKMKIILNYKNSISEKEERINEIEVKLSDMEYTKNYQIEVDEIEKRLRTLRCRRDEIIKKQSILESEIESLKKSYDSLALVSDKNKEILEYMAYAEAIRDYIESHYSEKEDSIREKLQEKVNEMFKKMYHGEREVYINEKYQTMLLTKVNGKTEMETGESEGLLRVKNFAFISGLVDLARTKALKIGDKVLEGESYPLILDAPFSNADEIHIQRISKELPEVAEQIIMFVMEKDWKYAESVMLDRVDRIYNLEKHTDTYTTIR